MSLNPIEFARKNLYSIYKAVHHQPNPEKIDALIETKNQQEIGLLVISFMHSLTDDLAQRNFHTLIDVISELSLVELLTPADFAYIDHILKKKAGVSDLLAGFTQSA